MKFITPWCSKCKRIKISSEELADELKEKAANGNNNSLLVLGDFDVTENDFPPYIVGLLCCYLLNSLHMILFIICYYFVIIVRVLFLLCLCSLFSLFMLSAYLFCFLSVNEFPTLLLFPARDKLNPVKCEDTQSIQKIRRFLKERVPVCYLLIYVLFIYFCVFAFSLFSFIYI